LNVELVLSARFENRDGAEDLHLCAIGQRLSRWLHRSPYWIACYTDWTGRRLKKSTKLTNKKNALDVALALEYGEEQARKGAFTEARLRALLEQTLEGHRNACSALNRSWPRHRCYFTLSQNDAGVTKDLSGLNNL
jgi:hypothetical protein